MRFQGHHPGLLHLFEYLVQHGQQARVLRCRRRSFQQGRDLRHAELQHLRRRTDDERSNRGAANDDELRWLIEYVQRPAGHEVSADCRAENDDESDD